MVQATNNLGHGPNSTIETVFSAEACEFFSTDIDRQTPVQTHNKISGCEGNCAHRKLSIFCSLIMNI